MRTRPVNGAVTVLRWIFRRGNDFLTCRLDRYPDRYVMMLIPHGEGPVAAIETVETTVRAYQHHASTAAQLRELGWVLVHHTQPLHSGPRPTPDEIAA